MFLGAVFGELGAVFRSLKAVFLFPVANTGGQKPIIIPQAALFAFLLFYFLPLTLSSSS